MSTLNNSDGQQVLSEMVMAIQENKAYLCDIDGLAGDGDHGMNMNKGFTMFESRFLGAPIPFTEGLFELGQLLLNEIGGSMGPIYGTIFTEMGDTGKGLSKITLSDFARMMRAGIDGLYEIIEARG